MFDPTLDPSQERHVLIIEDDRGCRSLALDAATYSLGRDQTSAIVLDSKNVSRQQALLLRLPIPGSNQYRYRLVDGNSAGKPSANGMTVNGKAYTTHDLENGDVIVFGGRVKASYQVVRMDAVEFVRYLDMINFQSIKSAPLNAFETMVGGESSTDVPTSIAPPNGLLSLNGSHATLQASDTRQSLKSLWRSYLLIGVVGMVLGLSIGSGVLLATGQLKVNPTGQVQLQDQN